MYIIICWVLTRLLLCVSPICDCQLQIHSISQHLLIRGDYNKAGPSILDTDAPSFWFS